MAIKRNRYRNKKEKKIDLQKRISYIDLKYNLDKTLQQISKNTTNKKKS